MEELEQAEEAPAAEETENSSVQPESRRDILVRVATEAGMLERPESESDAEATDAEPEPQETASETPKGRKRDGKGRFSRGASESQGQPPAESETEEPSSPIPVPISWPAEQKERFLALPRETQEYLSSREQERDAFLQRERQQIAEVTRAIEPYSAEWERAGITPGQVIKHHLAWAEYIKQNPREAILKLAADHGLSPQQVFGPNASAQSAGGYVGADPALEARLAQIENWHVSQQEQQRAQVWGNAEQTLVHFFSERDADGNLLRPYLEEVKPRLKTQIAAIRAENPTWPHQQVLEEAYRVSTLLTPGLSERLQAAEAAKQEKARIAEQQQRIQGARRMGSSVSGAPNGAMTKPVPKDRRELIRAAVYGEL